MLGREVFEPLWTPETQRTLRIQLPGAEQEENHLAAALARVPWEIARPRPDQDTLGQRNLLVRIVHDMQAPVSEPLQPWLLQRQTNLDELQSDVDQFLDQARQAAEE